MVAREQRGHRPHERTVVVQRPGHQVRAVELHQQQRRRVGIDLAARWFASMSFGRPGRTARRHRLPRVRAPRRAAGPSSKPSTCERLVDARRAGCASSMIASSSRCGSRADTGCGGRAELPARDRGRDELDRVRQRDRDQVALATPLCGSAARGAIRERSSSARAHVRCSSVSAGRSGSASAWSPSRCAYEIRATSGILPEFTPRP